MTSNSWLFRKAAMFQNPYFCFIYQFSHFSIIHYNYLIIHNQISFLESKLAVESHIFCYFEPIIPHHINMLDSNVYSRHEVSFEVT